MEVKTPRDSEIALRQELDAAKQEIAHLNRWGVPSYDADCLRVWSKRLDFMSDEKFIAAYQAGMNSDHRLDRYSPSRIDIHIEWRIHVCCWAAWHAKQLAGDFVECGTNTGIMSLAICKYIDFNSTDKSFYLFDTYCGIPEDQIRSDEQHALEQNLSFRDCFETAKQNFAQFPRAVLIKGKVPDTLSLPSIDKVCYLMLDMNIVTPEKAALKFFWDKLVPGAIVLFDDYGWAGYDAQKTAHDEFATSKGAQILTLPTGQGMLLKP